MKTFRQIEEHGDMQRYMEDLGEATRQILPSTDGDPVNRCRFIVIVTDDECGLTNYITDLSEEEAVSLLNDTAYQIVKNASQESGSQPEEPK